MFSYSASCLLSLKNPTSFFADKLDLCFHFEKKKEKKKSINFFIAFHQFFQSSRIQPIPVKDSSPSPGGSLISSACLYYYVSV